MGLWKILCFLIFLEKSWGQEQIYIISAPKIFYVGASENITIQAYGYTEAFNVTIFIKSYPDKNLSYFLGFVNLSPENKFQNSSMLTIQPKQLSGGQSSVSHVYLEVVSEHFSVSEQVPVTYDNGALFPHTNKTMTVPHQSGKLGGLNISPKGSYTHNTSRIFRLNASLKDKKCKIYEANLSPSVALEQKIHEHAAKYKHPVLKKCCYDGAHLNMDETCEERGARVKVGPRCIRAFNECCAVANKIRAEYTHKVFHLGRGPAGPVLPRFEYQEEKTPMTSEWKRE